MSQKTQPSKLASNLLKPASKRVRVFAQAGLLAIAIGATACAPKDEKVSSRNNGGGFSSSGGETNSKLGDRGSEYTRSMLIELADVAHQAETVLRTVDQSIAPTAQVPELTPTAQVPELTLAGEARPLVTPACKSVEFVPTVAGSLEFKTTAKFCEEKGATFKGKQSGLEKSFATLVPSSGTVATFQVEGIGIETELIPNANVRDSLRVETNRMLEAQFVGEQNGERSYRFTFESNSSYSLSLKELTDTGTIVSTIDGVFTYNSNLKKITSFRAFPVSAKGVQDTRFPLAAGRMVIRVDSARVGRNGGRLVRQEYLSGAMLAASDASLFIDLDACSLPTGALLSSFTVRPLLAKDKKPVVDSTDTVESFKDHVVGKADGKLESKLCSVSEQITMTEFYAGLLY